MKIKPTDWGSMKIETEVDNCGECPHLERSNDMSARIVWCKKAKTNIINENIIPDFCPFKVHEYQL